MTRVLEHRDYQHRLITKALDRFRDGVTSINIESPPGSGKTIMGFTILKHLIENSRSLLDAESDEVGIAWVAMRRNLLAQAKRENEELIQCPNVQFISMFEKKPHERLIEFKKRILVYDESHHEACDTAQTVTNAINPAITLGLSATPVRTDRMRLCFQTTLKDAGFHTLIQQGYLSEFDHWMLEDWEPKTVAEAYVAHRDRWGSSIIYFLTYEECQKAAVILAKHNVRCEIVTAKTDRYAQLEAFEAGKLDVLLNMYILTEGFDHPPLRSIWVRDSHNRGPTTQMAGRVLRKHHTKPCANIIQSVKTKFPFTRIASPKIQYVRKHGKWLSVGSNQTVQRVQNLMIQRMVKSESSPETVKALQFLNRNRDRRLDHWLEELDDRIE